MDGRDLVERARLMGAAGIREEDRSAFAYRPGEGRIFRRELVDRLLVDYSAADLPLLRELIAQEIIARKEHGGCGRVLFALALMLYAIGNVEDILLVHEAKYCNMDAGSQIDVFMLTMQQSEAVAREFVANRLKADPNASSWPLDRVLSDLRDAFTLDADYATAADVVAMARVELDTTYGEDLFDEDADD